MEMLTEVMSLMLLNKNDAVVKFAGLETLPDGAKLTNPDVLSKKRRNKQRQEKSQADDCEEEKMSKDANKESGKPRKKKSFEERLAEYEAAQKQATTQEQMKHSMRLQMYVQH